MIPGFPNTADQPDYAAATIPNLSLADIARIAIDRYHSADADLLDHAQRVRFPTDPDRDDRARRSAEHRAVLQTRYRLTHELASDRAEMIRDNDDWQHEWVTGCKAFRMTFAGYEDDGGYPYPNNRDD